ncbi:hypothetical protein [Gordonia sp. (in: high G+C Gram-positive bacteria)]|jgi:predicted DNA-binding protein|nr:hypothetical protein [Gordonia sp. (in: high G+C Gram-positive bacteria)]MCB1296114.1 hypothetical protein [Gordonia sp. (in: high G+C Gram-positive bacteria)]HMS74128.1 hypothetical protein [Gordonia sp. (in: high G+C Gram-positive bacteria)]
MLAGKIITGAGMIAAVAIVFYLTDMPGWAYAFPAADTKARLDELAAAKGMGTSKYVRAIIDRHLADLDGH